MFIVAITLRDVFVGVIVPRADDAPLRISRYLARGLWRIWPSIAYRLYSDELKREDFLGTFAPFQLVLSLAMWVTLLILGWGLFFYGIRDQLRPPDLTFAQSVYYAGASLLTIGYGDIVGTTTLAHTMSLVAAACGLGVVAVVATYLFSIFGSFQRRETFIVAIGARSGAPPSGVGLLIEHANAGIVADLAQVFRDAQSWIAEVMESHLAYPILTLFRSSHDYQSWVGTLGALMDASALAITTIDVDANVRGQALIMYTLGRHLTHDFSDYFVSSDDGTDAGIERSEFENACDKLTAAGHRIENRDAAWQRFSELRQKYAAQLNSLARWLEIPPVQWVGDRTLLKSHTVAVPRL
ncbi:MAG TPA: potassium channel family protein [Candidatus Rubrimentiphilum sp.]|nr:potassium channel family protein [Candidatus Rubrimentiphilum sp.]